MKDLAIALDNHPGALADMGEALGKAGVSVEGGGAWVVDGKAVAHFLFEDGTAARKALDARGIKVLAEREVVIQRLKQAVPGQLGKLARRMGDAGVNIEVIVQRSQQSADPGRRRHREGARGFAGMGE